MSDTSDLFADFDWEAWEAGDHPTGQFWELVSFLKDCTSIKVITTKFRLVDDFPAFLVNKTGLGDVIVLNFDDVTIAELFIYCKNIQIGVFDSGIYYTQSNPAGFIHETKERIKTKEDIRYLKLKESRGPLIDLSGDDLSLLGSMW